MLRQRITTALILFIATGGVLFMVPEPGFAIAAWFVCLIGIYELTNMYQFNKLNQIGLMLTSTGLAMILYAVPYDFSQIVRIVSVIMWCFIVPGILTWRPQKFNHSIISVFAILIFIPAFYALVKLYWLLGPWRLVSIMAIAWIADIGAFFVGRKFGKQKLAINISPGKSVEGAIGGLIFVGMYLFILKLFNTTIYLYSIGAVFKFSMILTSVSIVGDLFESWLKRVAKVKDSGTILPGHGGVFDRIDSLVAVLAIAFALIWVG